MTRRTAGRLPRTHTVHADPAQRGADDGRASGWTRYRQMAARAVYTVGQALQSATRPSPCTAGSRIGNPHADLIHQDVDVDRHARAGSVTQRVRDALCTDEMDQQTLWFDELLRTTC